MSAEKQSGLAPHDIQAANAMVTQMAIRALIATHPNSEDVRVIYDQLLAQAMTTPVVLDTPGMGAYLREASGRMFSRP